MLFDVPVHELTAGDGDKALLTADGGRNRGHGADFGHLKNRLRLRSGGRYAMIGRNGCGKSTLLRALASGTLPEWPGSIRTFLVEQDHRIDPEQQVIEAVLSADSRVSDLQAEAARLERESAEARESATERLCEIYEALEELDAESEGLRRHRVEAILGGLGFTAEMQGAAVGELSGGWQARLAMASALFVEPELLLLDEPTNHLDLRGLRWLQRYLRDEFRGTMLVVAHDRAFLDAVATDIILFEGVKGTLTYFHGTLEERGLDAEEMRSPSPLEPAARVDTQPHRSSRIHAVRCTPDACVHTPEVHVTCISRSLRRGPPTRLPRCSGRSRRSSGRRSTSSSRLTR